VYFLVFIAVLFLMYGYIGWRIIVPAGFCRPVILLLWGILITLMILFLLPIVMRFNEVRGAWIDVIAWIGYLSFGFFTLLLAMLVAKDLILLVVSGIRKLAQIFNRVADSGQTAVQTVDPKRRWLLMNSINACMLGVTATLTGYGMFEALRDPDVVQVTVPIKDLPADLDGFRIIQITDLHVSHTLKRPFVQSVVDKVNELKPDLVALTGDLVDGSVRELQDDVAPLADLKAPCGIYFITGNHEYYSGVQQWVAETARLGFTVLLNENRVIRRGEGRLLLAGVTDHSGGQFLYDHVSDPQGASAGAPTCHAKILLAHQPRSIFAAAEAGYHYMISGHTHGGQYFPYHFLAALAQPYISGLHMHGNTRIYVSRGTGYWGPQIRIGAPSEITVHRLVSA
jgi:predicted MPP superfamily phosphohydrolase